MSDASDFYGDRRHYRFLDATLQRCAIAAVVLVESSRLDGERLPDGVRNNNNIIVFTPVPCRAGRSTAVEGW